MAVSEKLKRTVSVLKDPWQNYVGPVSPSDPCLSCGHRYNQHGLFEAGEYDKLGMCPLCPDGYCDSFGVVL